MTADDWQPIETAPRDREVLLYFPAYRHGASGSRTFPPMQRVGKVGEYPNRKPTHWRPLPLPPKE